MNNVIKTSSKGARQGGIGLKNILNEGIFTNVIYYSEFADGRKYVGQTTQGLLKRHKDHMYDNRGNNHYNNVLQKHMDEAIIYPICFGVEGIEDIDTQDLLNGLEVAEIMLRETFNDVDPENGLNHTTGGYSHEKSEASKQKQKDFWASEEGQKVKEERSKFMDDYWTEERRVKRSEDMEIINAKIYGTLDIDVIFDLIEAFATTQYAAKELNTSTTKINKTLRKAGYEKYPNLLYKQIVKEFLEENMSVSEFAKLNDVSENIVKTALTKHNIRIGIEIGGEKYNVDKTGVGYRIREKNHTTIISKISSEERANELCNMLNNNDLTLKELRKMKLKGQI